MILRIACSRWLALWLCESTWHQLMRRRAVVPWSRECLSWKPVSSHVLKEQGYQQRAVTLPSGATG